jgi:hypothetical protein
MSGPPPGLPTLNGLSASPAPGPFLLGACYTFGCFLSSPPQPVLQPPDAVGIQAARGPVAREEFRRPKTGDQVLHVVQIEARGKPETGGVHFHSRGDDEVDILTVLRSNTVSMT